MLIECTVKREAPVVVSIGNETYKFLPDAEGRKVAEVWIAQHIKCFLAVATMYRELAAEQQTVPRLNEPAPARREVAPTTIESPIDAHSFLPPPQSAPAVNMATLHAGSGNPPKAKGKRKAA